MQQGPFKAVGQDRTAITDVAPGELVRSGELRRSATIGAFAIVGASLGLALGFIEALLFRYIPRFRGLSEPDVSGAIWMIAPLADAPLGALAGLMLGGIAVLPQHVRPLWQRIWAACGFALAAAYLGWLFFWFRIGQGIIVPNPFPARSAIFNWALTPVIYFVIALVISTALVAWSLKRREIHPQPSHHRRRRRVAVLNAVVAAGLAMALLVVGQQRQVPFPAQRLRTTGTGERNNVALIMLDTMRADHLGCYGYSRTTTPNLDRLAQRGVLFEDAIAPTSWTLPSLASVLTGLLPHQHAADWYVSMSSQPVTLADILKSRGFETAGFNANPDFGLAGWGLGQGFDVYFDAHDWLRHNLAVTFAGQSLYQALFREFVGFNQFDRLNAGQINQQVLDWLGHRSSRPYFLFINYMDAHRPYVPPAPYDRRFGRIPKSLLWRISSQQRDGRWSRPIADAERQDMIDGYDNSLSYLDAQVGRLLDALEHSPDGARTYVIVAGDHGEGFGEHGTYDHGWDLYREVLRVPLLVAGPGIPSGQRISGARELRELFPTVLQLALGKADPQISAASLSRFWIARAPAKDAPPLIPVVSELNYWTSQWRRQTVLSLTDSRWHYLVDAQGHTELYDQQSDETEQHNLAGSPGLQNVVQQLRRQMQAVVATSVLPWRNQTYLSALDEPEMPFVRRAAANTAAFGLISLPVGSCQAPFLNQARPEAPRPTPSQEDLLRSLPYH